MMSDAEKEAFIRRVSSAIRPRGKSRFPALIERFITGYRPELEVIHPEPGVTAVRARRIERTPHAR